jgi:hypothetical protein
MTEASVQPLRERGGTPPTGSVQPIEIVAPDRYRTALLLEYAAPVFPAEIVSGSAWTVRLQPPSGGGWVLELLTLVERWLESARLPDTTLLYGGRSYLIRASTDLAQFRTMAEPPASLSPEVH